VKVRTQRWANSGLWEAMLAETARVCQAAGITRPGAGGRLGRDGPRLDTNAAIVSLEAIPPESNVFEGRKGGEGDGGADAPRVTTPLPSGAAPAGGTSQAPALRLEAGGQPRGPHQTGETGVADSTLPCRSPSQW
jgi:hypothetical protein